MTINIDKDIPPPLRRVGRFPKYPWRSLNIGESFSVTGEMSLLSMRSQCGRAGKKLGMKFVVRDDGKQLRVWRVK